MNLKPIQLASSFEGISTKKDGSISIRISTQELTPAEKMQAMEYINQFGWMMFSPNRLTDQDLPKEDAPDEGRKTDSQRLRSVLWLYHKQQGGKEEDFENFKHRYYEKRIEEIKSKLE